MKSKIRLNGNVTVTVRNGDGGIKTYRKSIWRQIFGIPSKKMIIKHHNTITAQGDALIADWLLETPTQTKVDGSNGHMQLGNGWTGNSVKQNTRCNMPLDVYGNLDSGYPRLKASFGSNGDASVLYKCTFAVGSLNASDIDEVCLLNGNVASAKCLAYAQITPAVSVTNNDTLTIEWEITILGS